MGMISFKLHGQTIRELKLNLKKFFGYKNAYYRGVPHHSVTVGFRFNHIRV